MTKEKQSNLTEGDRLVLDTIGTYLTRSLVTNRDEAVAAGVQQKCEESLPRIKAALGQKKKAEVIEAVRGLDEFGKKGLSGVIAVLCDQPGAFLAQQLTYDTIKGRRIPHSKVVPTLTRDQPLIRALLDAAKPAGK